MEVDEHTLLSLRREVERLRAEMDQLRAEATLRVGNGMDEDNGGGLASGDEGYQQPHDVSLVQPVEADGASIDERENGDDEDDDTAGNLQIKGFAGKNKIDATELELTDSVSDEEFICRTSGGGLGYRKLSSSGGGGGGGKTGYYNFLDGFELVNDGISGSASWVLRILYKTGSFVDGLLVGESDEQHIDIPVSLHSSIAQEDS